MRRGGRNRELRGRLTALSGRVGYSEVLGEAHELRRVARGREAGETRRAASSRASRGAVTALWLECSGCVVTGRVWEYRRGYCSPGSWTRRAERDGWGRCVWSPPTALAARPPAVPLLSPRSPPPHLGRAPAMLARSLRPLAAAPRAAAPRAISSSVAKSALQAQQASSRAALRVALDAARCTTVSPAGARRFASSEPSSDGSVDVSPLARLSSRPTMLEGRCATMPPPASQRACAHAQQGCSTRTRRDRTRTPSLGSPSTSCHPPHLLPRPHRLRADPQHSPHSPAVRAH